MYQSWWVVLHCAFPPRRVSTVRLRSDAASAPARTYRCVGWAAAPGPSLSRHLSALQVQPLEISPPGAAHRPDTAGFISCRISRCRLVPVITDRVSRERKAIGSIRLSICLSICPSICLSVFSTLSFEPTDLWTWVCLCRGWGLWP